MRSLEIIFRELPELRLLLECIQYVSNDSWVVGGAVRDTLAGSTHISDFDVVAMGGAQSITEKLRRDLDLPFAYIPLDETRGIFRLVSRLHPKLSIDVCDPKSGAGIESDLRSRDFTINAMAVKVGDLLKTGLTRVTDPLGGQKDLADRVINACSSHTFSDDPLRILRAYRFCAQKEFSIDHTTLEAMRDAVPELEAVSGERVRDELFLILETCRAGTTICEMDKTGTPEHVVPEILALKGLEQNHYHHLDAWHHTIEVITFLDKFMSRIPEMFGSIGQDIIAYLEHEPVLGRKRTAWLKFTALCHDLGKRACMTRDTDGRIRFIGHEKLSAEQFATIGRRLRLSKREIKQGSAVIAGHMRIAMALQENMTSRARRRLCADYGTELIGLTLLGLADLAAAQGPARSAATWSRAVARASVLLHSLFDRTDQPLPMLLTGHDIMRELGLPSGPNIGIMLNYIRELQNKGVIQSPEQALNAIKAMAHDRNDEEAQNTKGDP
jgi:tRNA nucleotidyltransferase/poly(A) polymerase